jgi:hypothetical protein
VAVVEVLEKSLLVGLAVLVVEEMEALERLVQLEEQSILDLVEVEVLLVILEALEDQV